MIAIWQMTLSNSFLWKKIVFIFDRKFTEVCGRIRQHSLQWCHNGWDAVSNHQPYDFLLNRLLRRMSKKIWKFRVTGLCAMNSPVTFEMTSNAENISIWWRDHASLNKGLAALWKHAITWANDDLFDWGMCASPDLNDSITKSLDCVYGTSQYKILNIKTYSRVKNIWRK